MTYSLSDVWSLLLPLVLLPLAICATTHLVRQFAWAEVDGYLQLRGTEEQRAHDGCFAAAGWVPNAVDHIHDRSSLARSRALNGYLIDLSSIPNQYNFTSICQQDSARSCLWKDASLWISIPVLDSTSVHRMLSDTTVSSCFGLQSHCTPEQWLAMWTLDIHAFDTRQAELEEEGEQLRPPGFVMIQLPWAEEIRSLSAWVELVRESGHVWPSIRKSTISIISPAICVFSHCGIPLGKGAKLCNIIRMPCASLCHEWLIAMLYAKICCLIAPKFVPFRWLLMIQCMSVQTALLDPLWALLPEPIWMQVCLFARVMHVLST